MSAAGITRLSSIWPHFFGHSWSSIWIAATPTASYSRTVRMTLIGLP
jgi:hypothetical protein